VKDNGEIPRKKYFSPACYAHEIGSFAMIERDPVRCRFHLNEIAYLEYKITKGELVIMHTMVPKSLGGKGIGSQLVESAMRFAQAENMTIRSECTFAEKFLSST
jgi:predicted GNAT family acetyltransferase